MKKIIVNPWGNSLGVRIPKQMMDELKIGEGSELYCEVKNGQIVLIPVGRKYTRNDSIREAIRILEEVLPNHGKENSEKK